MRALRIVVKTIGWLILAVLLLVTSTLLTAVIVGRTDWGHRKLLGVALPQIRKQLAGELRIGRLDGNLTRELTLHDVELDDKEHRPAVRVRTLTVRYDLLALVRHTIDLRALSADGVWVHARMLRDGKLNLAELTRPSQEEKPKSAESKPYRIHVRKLSADVEALYDPPPAPDARRVHAVLRLEARADVNGGAVDLGIESLSARTHAPLVALLSAKGELHDQDGALSAHGLDVVVSSEGRQLQQLLPSVKLRGRWSVAVRADGPADKLDVSVAARPPAGKLELAAQLRSRAGKPGTPAPDIDALEWRGTIEARGIDPAQAVDGAPRGDVRLDARGQGRGTHGAIDLRALDAAIAGATIHARGKLDTAGDVDAVAKLDAPDLSRLRTLGVKNAGGALSLNAKIHRARRDLDVDADATGKEVRLGANHVGALALHVHTHDYLGAATLAAQRIETPQIVLDDVQGSAEATRQAITANLSARGPHKTSVELLLHGRPTVQRQRDGWHLIGADVTIDRLSAQRYDQKLALAQPAQLAVHRVIALAGLVLQSGGQKLALDGQLDRKTDAIQASLRGSALNLNELVRFGKPSLDLPTTSLDLTLTAHGTRKQPIADLSLSGWSERKQLVINRIHYNAKLHYGDERARGEFVIAAIDEHVQGKLDLPVVLTGDRSLSLEIAAKNVNASKLRKVLPPRVAALEGRIDGNVRLAGTTLRPQLELALHGRSLELHDSKDHDLAVNVKYGERHLEAHAQVTLAKTTAGDGGSIKADVQLPIALSAAALQKQERLVDELVRKTPIDVTLTIARLDLAKVPFAQAGMAPPVRAGRVDGAIRLRGTVRAPELDGNVEAHGLAKGKLDRLDVMLDAHYRDRRARAEVEARLRDATLLHLRAETPLDAERLLDGRPWRDTPVTVDAEVPQYPLDKLADLVPQLAGALALRARVRGTMAHPTGTLDGKIAALQLGAMKYDRFTVDGGFDGRTIRGKLDAHEVKGGAFAADAQLPIDARAPLFASLRAHGFYIDVQNADITNPRLVKGTLDASLDVTGTRAQPTATGALHFRDGQLALASDPRIYDRIQLDVQTGNGTVALQHLEAHLSDGSIVANGTLTLAGLRPQTVELKAYARKFPVEPGQFGVWVDADVTVKGRADNKGMTGYVSIDKGTANLPKLSTGKKLQPTGPLKDVRFVDPAALAAERRRKEAEKAAATTTLMAVIPGPFHVRSKELSLDLKGKLQVAITGPVARITGHVEELSTGWFELLGRRYNVEKARVGFGGEVEPDPELDVRLTREITNTTIVIEVHGTAKKPQLVLASDPPIYDQSQVIAVILSGDPATQRVDDRSLDQKVTGAVSSLLVGKIKDQIAPNLPIDVIKVDTGNEGSTGLADTRIEVGKYITDTIYVSYVHQFGSLMVGTERLNSNEANLDWRFYRHYELDTAFGDAAVGHVNLFWTIRF